jgi:catechol 2,3-dioxygenase-like lactoylglutathione lyase family enzyme
MCPLLQVFDMPTALAFYRDVLGFSIVDAAPAGASGDEYGWAWLRRDDVELMLNTAYDPDVTRPPLPDAARVAGHGDTILFIGAPDVDAVCRHLQSSGIDVNPPTVAHYGMKQLFVRDPDGFGLCFQWKATG